MSILALLSVDLWFEEGRFPLMTWQLKPLRDRLDQINMSLTIDDLIIRPITRTLV
jgi:hypothetical protein